MKRKILSLALCGCLVAGMFPAVALADDSQATDTTPVVTTETTRETPTSGQCGDWLSWSYQGSDKTLTISNNGDMWNYSLQDSPAPWSGLDFTTLNLDSNVNSIGANAFAGAAGLTEVKISSSVFDIGYGAFANCASLKEFTIPGNVSEISYGTFEGCSSLTTVTIPQNVTSIQANAFADCSALNTVNYAGTQEQWETISIESGNEVLTSATVNYNYTPTSGYCGFDTYWSYEQASKTLTISGQGETYDYEYRFIPWLNLDFSTVKVEQGITSLGRSTFLDCTSVTNVSLPNTLTVMDYAFPGCTGLKKVTIPDSVTSMMGAFSTCTSLTTANIPKNAIDVWDAFGGCTNLTSISIPDGVKNISCAFNNCTSLKTVNIPDSVTDISLAFQGCTSLTSVTVPENVDSMAHAFYGCTSLTNVNIPNKVTSLYNSFVNCTSLTSITIPDSVTYMEYTFAGCTSLTSITIPDSVIYMEYTFAGCTNLNTVNIPVSITTIGENSFADCTNLSTVNYAGTQAQWEAIDIVESGNDILDSVTVNYTETPVTPTPTPAPTQKPEPTPAPETPAQDKVEVTVSGDKAEATVGGVDIVLGNAGKVFQAGTTVTVEKITQGTIYDTVKKALEKVVTKMDNTAIFEFTAAKDGKPVQPGGALSVTFDIPKNLSASNLKMFYVSEDGKYEEVQITVDTKAGTVTANLTHFSTYVLANVAPTSGGKVPQTGDNSQLTTYVCILVMAMAGLTILMVNKRRA